MKQQKYWGIAIVVLIAWSIFTIFGTHYDRTTHKRIRNNPPHYGLDISGGIRATLRARVGNGVAFDQDTVRKILANRIDSAGVAGATVINKGTDQFVVELPEVKDKNDILQRIGQTAEMTFYYFKTAGTFKSGKPIIVEPYNTPDGHEHYMFVVRATSKQFRDGAAIRQDLIALKNTIIPNDPKATPYTIPTPLSLGTDQAILKLTPAQIVQVNALNDELKLWQSFIASQQVILHGADIEPKSEAHLDANTNQPIVTQVFNSKGSREFANFTTQHVGELNGIVLDDSVISAPNIEQPILDGTAEISGGFATLAEAKQLADLLNAGALPVALDQVQVKSLDATLGPAAVHKSIVAGLVGLTFVLVFMLAWYRLPGLVADIALLIYSLFVYAIFLGGASWLIPSLVITFTLPGIVGFILSVGMAVDANILIFERMKEELRSGKTLKASIDAGFKRAFTAIRDSNICTMITCVVLLSLGTPEVRGFAITLLVGVFVSLFSAITVTRTLLYAIVNSGLKYKLSWFGVGGAKESAPRRRLNIIGRRKIFYTASLLVIIPGLVFWLGLNGLKKSIEFTGGMQIGVAFTHPATHDQVEKSLVANGFKDTIIQMSDGGMGAFVSTSRTSPIANKYANPVYVGLMNAMQPFGPQEQSFDTVGSLISKELTARAFEAVVVASGLIVLYLSIVFAFGGFATGVRYGTSAIIALIHDVFVLIGIFAIFGYTLGWKIDSLFVTALLTVIGFSVHDTVVIFDRVRENRRAKVEGREFETLVNDSVQQSLARSINTSLTVLMTLLALILLGGQTTRLLNVALFIGILSGTYSSIFNAAAILVDWENYIAKRRASGRKTGVPVGVLATRSVETVPSVSGLNTPDTTLDTDDASDDGRTRPKTKRPVRRF